MKLPAFKLEEYLEKFEFSAPYLLCVSDPESWALKDVLALANAEERKMWDELKLSYTEVKGLPLLRETIAHQLYPGMHADNILGFAGAGEGIFCTLFAACEPDDHVIVVTPCYQSLLEIPRLKGCDITEVELREENNWALDLAEIKKAIRPQTKWLIMNFPHNPTGQTLSQGEMLELTALLDQHGIWLFADEVYRLLGNPGMPWPEPAACLYKRAVSLGVTSKAFGMGGLRIGWIACQDKSLLLAAERIKQYTSLCSSVLSEIITLIVIRNKNTILQRNNEIVARNFKLVEEFISRHSTLFSWVKSQGGCIGLIKYYGSEKVDDFCTRLVKDKGVLLMPASLYGLKSNHFRIGFGRANMPQALQKLEEFIA